MSTGSTTVRVSTATAERIAQLRRDQRESTDDIVRKALDALYWARMAEAAQRMTDEQRLAYENEAALWDQAQRADIDQPQVAHDLTGKKRPVRSRR